MPKVQVSVKTSIAPRGANVQNQKAAGAAHTASEVVRPAQAPSKAKSMTTSSDIPVRVQKQTWGTTVRPAAALGVTKKK